MPNRWESSARPLSVRTVFVNGSRHAVLFEEDPLGSAHLKKFSRSSSSLSFGSDLSITSSESQDSNSEERVHGGQRQRKDLSSELQSCLIKLRLASEGLGSGSKSEGKCCCHTKGKDRRRQETSGEGKHGGKRDQSCRRNSSQEFQEEPRENTIGRRIARSGSCYFYKFDSSKRKKNYCVVKISSQPAEFTESCTCDELCEGRTCRGCPSAGKDMVISATIHNLLMTSRKERLSGHKLDTAFLCGNPDSTDLCWNTYLTKSYYNSLSERVFQWLDLRSRRKSQNPAVDLTPEGDIPNSIERICSGKRFLGESKKTECCDENRQRNKVKRENTKSEDVETEVTGEPNVITVLSETAENDSRTCPQEQTTATAPSKESAVTTSLQPNPSENSLKTHTLRKPKSGKSIKVQDLLLDYDWGEKIGVSLGKRSRRRMREIRDSWRSQSNRREAESTEEEGESTTANKHWEEGVFGRGGKCGEQTACRCNRSADGHADKVKGRLPTAGFRERNEKSINNLNFTRGRPVLIKDLLPSQQRDDVVSLRTEKAVWGSEKGTGRLQLHIFMPTTVLLKDGSDDSTSECENVINLC